MSAPAAEIAAVRARGPMFVNGDVLVDVAKSLRGRRCWPATYGRRNCSQLSCAQNVTYDEPTKANAKQPFPPYSTSLYTTVPWLQRKAFPYHFFTGTRSELPENDGPVNAKL